MARDLLFVGVGVHEFERIKSALAASTYRCDFISSATGALELLSLLPFDLIAVACPLEDQPVERFLDALRAPASAARQTAVVLLADELSIAEATSHLGRGASRVVSLEHAPEVLQIALPRLLGPAPRVPLRALTRLEVPCETGRMRVLCQTVNVSSTGMLLRIDEDYPIGLELDFELSLPGQLEPVRGRGEVVRCSASRREPLRGVGFEFREFRGRDGARLAAELSARAIAAAVEGDRPTAPPARRRPPR